MFYNDELKNFYNEAKRKRGVNELCWCLSGKKYKKCHLNKNKKVIPTFGQLTSINHKLFNVKTCLHPDKSTCDGKRIRAHTIQRNGHLSNIADKGNKVLMMRKNRFDKDGVELIGWKEASTFYGFCSFHDINTFKEIETKPFTGDLEQCFLYYYRSLCYEFYQKEALIEILTRQKENCDDGQDLNRQIEIQFSLNHIISQFNRTLEELTVEKEMADGSILSKNYNEYSHIIINCHGKAQVYLSSHFHLAYDLTGKRIYDLNDLNTFGEGASFNIIKKNNDLFSIVISWHKDFKNVGEFVKRALKMNTMHLLNSIFQLFFAQSENCCFSQNWWEKLSLEQKSLLIKLYYESDENFGLEIQPETNIHGTFIENIQKINF